MSISQTPAEPSAPTTTTTTTTTSNGNAIIETPQDQSAKTLSAPPKKSLDTTSASTSNSVDPTTEFSGEVDTDNTLPSQEMLNKVADFPVLDKDGKSRTFKSVYTGPMVARRVLVIFVRHFFCGNCQEYLRTLSSSITTDALLQLPVPTFIAVIGCGSPSLIPMYQEATGCPFPIYADPTKRLYNELGMTRTLALGSRPEYMRKGMLLSMSQSVIQGLKQLKNGLVTKAGDIQQVGGEFLFEPTSDMTASPLIPSPEEVEEKRVTWCHRMRNSRDHAEIPELREVLGLDGEGVSGGNKKRWTKALEMRKGTGLSGRTSMSLDRNMSEKLMPSTADASSPAIVNGQ